MTPGVANKRINLMRQGAPVDWKLSPHRLRANR